MRMDKTQFEGSKLFKGKITHFDPIERVKKGGRLTAKGLTSSPSSKGFRS